MGLKSSAYAVDIALQTSFPISGGGNILSPPLQVTAESIGGSSGLFRVYFTLITQSAVDYGLAIRRNPSGGSAVNLILNGDNAFILKSGGYYRFDINIRPGDTIDFRTVDIGTGAALIASIPEFRIDQIQIGA